MNVYRMIGTLRTTPQVLNPGVTGLLALHGEIMNFQILSSNRMIFKQEQRMNLFAYVHAKKELQF